MTCKAVLEDLVRDFDFERRRSITIIRWLPWLASQCRVLPGVVMVLIRWGCYLLVACTLLPPAAPPLDQVWSGQVPMPQIRASLGWLLVGRHYLALVAPPLKAG